MLYDYEEEFKKAYRNNIYLVEQHLEEGKFDHKIRNFCSLFGFDKNLVIAEIKRSDILIALFLSFFRVV